MWKQYSNTPIAAASVPYFSPDCGERFKGIDDFPEALSRFMNNIDSYAPRVYVQNNLSFEESARLYVEHYISAMPD
jgi:hypothetical protein